MCPPLKHHQKPQPTKEQRVEHRETVAEAVLLCWTESSCPAFSQCTTNASRSWTCIRSESQAHDLDAESSLGCRTLLVGCGVRCGSTWSVLLSVVPGDTLWPSGTLERRQIVPTRHSATGGRNVMRAQLVFSRLGAGGMGANAVVGKSTFFECFQKKSRAPGNRR